MLEKDSATKEAKNRQSPTRSGMKNQTLQILLNKSLTKYKISVNIPLAAHPLSSLRSSETVRARPIEVELKNSLDERSAMPNAGPLKGTFFF